MGNLYGTILYQFILQGLGTNQVLQGQPLGGEGLVIPRTSIVLRGKVAVTFRNFMHQTLELSTSDQKSILAP